MPEGRSDLEWRDLLEDSVSCSRRRTVEDVWGYLICNLQEQENLTRLSKFHVVISNIPVLDLGSEQTFRAFLRVENIFYPFERIRPCRLA